MSLNGNLITGPIPSILPSGLQTLYVFGNSMTGDVPQLPPSLNALDLGYPGYPGNHFTGSIVLNQPHYLFINDNWITDVVVYDPIKKMGNCDLSFNPNIVNLTSYCTRNGIYSAILLPITIGLSTSTDVLLNAVSSSAYSSTASIMSTLLHLVTTSSFAKTTATSTRNNCH